MNQFDIVANEYLKTIAELNARCANLSLENLALRQKVEELTPKETPKESTKNG